MKQPEPRSHHDEPLMLGLFNAVGLAVMAAISWSAVGGFIFGAAVTFIASAVVSDMRDED